MGTGMDKITTEKITMTNTTMDNYINNIMKTKTLRMLMEELEETEQKASKIRTQINNVMKLKND